MSTGVLPEQFGSYRLDALIGRGGMGEVYRAFDETRRRVVALKRLPTALADDPQFQARFRAESRLAARLNSEHVIPIHDYGTIDGQLFIDMRLVEGEDLADRLAREGFLSPQAAVHVVEQVASALDAAHAAGLEHRDVKPSNILLSRSGAAYSGGASGRGATEHPFAYLVDFGIARAVDGTRGLTGTGSIIGTIAYMAPERFQSVPSDHRADVYSLAALLYESLVGHVPFPTDSVAATISAHLYAAPPRPSWERRGLPDALDAVVAWGMAKSPEQRYPSAGALAAAARAALEGRAVPGDGRATGSHPPGAPAGFAPSRATASRVPQGAHSPTPLTAASDAPPGPWAAPAPARAGSRGWWWAAGAVAAVVVIALGAYVGIVVSGGDGDLSTPSSTAASSGSGAPSGTSSVQITQTLKVVASSGTLAIDSKGQSIYVGNPAGSGESGEVEAYAVADGAQRATTPLSTPGAPTALTLSPDGAAIYAATADTPLDTSTPTRSALSFLDASGNRVLGELAMPARVDALVVSPDGRRLYAAAGDSVLIIDPAARSVVATVPTGQGGLGTALAVTPDGRELLVAGSAGVQRIDPVAARVSSTIGLRNGPSGIAVTPDGTRALVSTGSDNAVAVIDLRTGQALAAIPVGQRPGAVTITPDGTQALVINRDAASMSVIDLGASRVTSTVAVGSFPDAVALGPGGKYGYATTGSTIVRFDRG